MVMVSPASRSTTHLLLFLYASFFLLSHDVHHHVAADAGWPLSFSFDFFNRSTYSLDDLRFEGNASLHGNLVDLSCNSFVGAITTCLGRMSYTHPVPFYDQTTGEVASFATRFTFAIKTENGRGGRGDGMAFFLSSYPSTMPPTAASGSLGLNDGYATQAPFVAVEFDTFHNSFDPQGSDHIGIDINSVRNSVDTTSLPNYTLNWSMTASITFNSSSRLLMASLQFDDDASLDPVQVSTQLPDPVTSLLPSEVAVGFSAATNAKLIERHQILSWSFNSTLAPPLERKEKEKEKNGGLDWSGRYKIVQGICSGLHYLHHELDQEQNIVHMDLKASNVLISRGEGGDVTNVKIADFGLSRFFKAETHSYTKQIVGVRAYMAPEYLNKGRISPKADIYSFGLLILEIVTGRCAMVDDSSGHLFITWVRSEWSKGDVQTLMVMDAADLPDDCIAQARNCIEIALDCIQEDPNSRPDAEKIKQRISQV